MDANLSAPDSMDAHSESIENNVQTLVDMGFEMSEIIEAYNVIRTINPSSGINVSPT